MNKKKSKNVSKLSKEFELREKEIVEVSNYWLDKKIKEISKSFDDGSKYRLEIEAEKIIEANNSFRIMIAYTLSQYLKENNIYYTVEGNPNSSYVYYVLGITEIDPIKYNISAQIDMGINYDYCYSLNFIVSEENKQKVFKYIDELIPNKVLNIYSYGGEKGFICKDFRAIVIDDEMFKYTNYYDDINGDKKLCLNINDIKNNLTKVIRINILSNSLINIISRMTQNDEYNLKDKSNSLLDDPKILEQLIKYDKDNIIKSYIPEFNSDFAKYIIENTQPKTLFDLVSVLSLSKLSNDYLIISQIDRHNIKDIICTKDDVYDYLLKHLSNGSVAMNIATNIVQEKEFKKDLIVKYDVNDDIKKFLINVKYLPSRGHVLSKILNIYKIVYLKKQDPLLFYKCLFEDKYSKEDIIRLVNYNQEDLNKEIKSTEKEIERKMLLDNDDSLIFLDDKLRLLRIYSLMMAEGIRIINNDNSFNPIKYIK